MQSAKWSGWTLRARSAASDLLFCRPEQLDAVEADVVRGRTLTSWPTLATDIRNAGGTWVDIPMDQAYTDGNFVTGPAWPALHAWLAQFLKVLGTRIEA